MELRNESGQMKNSEIKFGYYEDGSVARLDLTRLLVSRALLTAASGGGKSWGMRKLIEEISRRMQTFVIDSEGEFVTLREKRDMVLVGPGGEIAAIPRAAPLLCRRLMELNVSAVLDISELTPSERREFITGFCNTLVDLPRTLWRPLLVAIDEAHEFSEEHNEDECSKAMARLSSKGRKRGFCTLAATQRLSKLDKNFAAELKNQFIGQMILDTDLRRAADSLGFNKSHWAYIRDLSSGRNKEGEFFAVGPAFAHKGVKRIRFGEVETTHPKPGYGRIGKPPAPSAKIRGVLKELKDLPQEAEKEIADLKAAQKRIAELEREVRKAAASVPQAPAMIDTGKPILLQAAKIMEKVSKLAVTTQRERDTMNRAIDEAVKKIAFAMGEVRQKLGNVLENTEAVRQIHEVSKAAAEVSEKLKAMIAGKGEKVETIQTWEKVEPMKAWADVPPEPIENIEEIAGKIRETLGPPAFDDFASGAAVSGKMAANLLYSLAWWRSADIDGVSMNRLAAMAGYAPSGRVNSTVSALVGAGLVERIGRGGTGIIKLTNHPSNNAIDVRIPPDKKELVARIMESLPRPVAAILAAFRESGLQEISFTELAELAGRAPSGRFNSELSILSTRGIIERERKSKDKDGMIRYGEVLKWG
jgi:hypothetical protein